MRDIGVQEGLDRQCEIQGVVFLQELRDNDTTITYM